MTAFQPGPSRMLAPEARRGAPPALSGSPLIPPLGGAPWARGARHLSVPPRCSPAAAPLRKGRVRPLARRWLLRPAAAGPRAAMNRGSRPRLRSGQRCLSSPGAMPPSVSAAASAALASALCARWGTSVFGSIRRLFFRWSKSATPATTSQPCARTAGSCARNRAASAPADSHLYKLQACQHHDPELAFDRGVSASVAIMAVLLGQLFVGHVPPWPDDAWCRPPARRPAGAAPARRPPPPRADQHPQARRHDCDARQRAPSAPDQTPDARNCRPACRRRLLLHSVPLGCRRRRGRGPIAQAAAAGGPHQRLLTRLAALRMAENVLRSVFPWPHQDAEGGGGVVAQHARLQQMTRTAAARRHLRAPAPPARRHDCDARRRAPSAPDQPQDACMQLRASAAFRFTPRRSGVGGGAGRPPPW
jgi:hypothetical protein